MTDKISSSGEAAVDGWGRGQGDRHRAAGCQPDHDLCQLVTGPAGVDETPELLRRLAVLRRDRLNDLALGVDGVHRYVSTACLHGLHDRCRLVCKFCQAPCSCDHHEEREN